jgi:8-hydroxy-5-deazaflavin:NADPH oxidoreductase
MKIGVLGSGAVGEALGVALVELGHDVKMGARSATNEKAVAWAEKTGLRASYGTFADAAAFGELIVLATLGAANAQVIRSVAPESLRGKVIIDATNPLDFSTGGPRLVAGMSGGEQLQALAPESHVVKAFNTVGNGLMFRPKLAGGPPDMFICGNDERAKHQVAELLAEFGWGVVDLGGIDASHYLEAMCMVWVLYGFRTKSWNHAFKLLR